MKLLLTCFFSCLLVVCISVAPLSAHETEGQTKSAAPTVAVVSTPAPHCEVPCGIYADQMRFEMMLEDAATIAKAIASVNKIADGFAAGPPNATTMNQMTRWINTKENHATNTQHVIAQYFMTQRIKADNDNYAKQLAAAHKVMVSAMKCKQDANPKTAETLKAAIYDLYRAYEGKEPQFEKK